MHGGVIREVQLAFWSFFLHRTDVIGAPFY